MSVTTSGVLGTRGPEVRRVPIEAPWSWLASGWRDLWQSPRISLTYGLIFAVISMAITLGLWLWDKILYLPPLAAGFMLVGPMLAVGLYEVSRRLERGEKPTLRQALFVKTTSPAQLAFVGLLIMAVLLSWIYSAMVLFALFFGPIGVPPVEEFPSILLLTTRGLALLIIGTCAGAVMAALIFAASAVSVPMLLDRKLDFVTAVATSFAAVIKNWKPMLLWAALIVAITALGIVTLYVGLIVAFPLIGHATWHAYRDLVWPVEDEG